MAGAAAAAPALPPRQPPPPPPPQHPRLRSASWQDASNRRRWIKPIVEVISIGCHLEDPSGALEEIPGKIDNAQIAEIVSALVKGAPAYAPLLVQVSATQLPKSAREFGVTPLTRLDTFMCDGRWHCRAVRRRRAHVSHPHKRA